MQTSAVPDSEAKLQVIHVLGYPSFFLLMCEASTITVHSTECHVLIASLTYYPVSLSDTWIEVKRVQTPLICFSSHSNTQETCVNLAKHVAQPVTAM